MGGWSSGVDNSVLRSCCVSLGRLETLQSMLGCMFWGPWMDAFCSSNYLQSVQLAPQKLVQGSTDRVSSRSNETAKIPLVHLDACTRPRRIIVLQNYGCCSSKLLVKLNCLFFILFYCSCSNRTECGNFVNK